MKEPHNHSPTKKPRRLPAVERRHGAEIHDDSAHLWAVSYADFLMVLLCFFIIFFSTDSEKKQNILHQIFVTAGEGNGDGGPESRMTASAKDFSQDSLVSILSDFAVTMTKKDDGLLVQFQDDLYDKGAFRVEGVREKILSNFLTKVFPYRDQISMTFIGHADTSKVVFSEKKMYRDNFDLSAIRATNALQFAVKSGFPEDQVTAKGNSKNSRVSRTLSVLIRAKGDLL